MLCFYCVFFILSLVFTFPLDFSNFLRVLLTIFTCAVCFCGDFFFQMTSGASYFLVAMKILDCKWAQIMSLWSNYIHYSENKVHIIDVVVERDANRLGFSSREDLLFDFQFYIHFSKKLFHFSSKFFANYTYVPGWHCQLANEVLSIQNK